MKYYVMSVALPVSLALCSQPVLPPKRAMGGGCPVGTVASGPAERLPRMQPLPALQAKMCEPPFLPLPLSWAPSWWWARLALISRNSRQGGSLAAWSGVVAGNVFIGRDA